MNKFFTSSSALLALLVLGVPAMSADLPARMPVKAPPILEPIFTWTGFYGGINGGYSFGSAKTTARPAAGVQTFNTKPDGALAGAQIGYNWQAGNIVYGLEGDGQWTDEHDRLTCVAPTCGVTNAIVRNGLPWFGTARARLGVASDRWLVYATGGAAFGETRIDAAQSTIYSLADTDTRLGWTAGAGIEYAFVNNWSVKFEYLYVDLNRHNAVATGPGVAPVPFTTRWQDNIVRVGLNYRFSAPQPVVARY
jgi:outer membrane immunogenic protein